MTKDDRAAWPGARVEPVNPHHHLPWGQRVLSQGSPVAYSPASILTQGKLAPAQLRMPVCPGPLAHDGNPQDGYGNWVGTVGCRALGWQKPGAFPTHCLSAGGENSGGPCDSIITPCHSVTESQGLQPLLELQAAPLLQSSQGAGAKGCCAW